LLAPLQLINDPINQLEGKQHYLDIAHAGLFGVR
jgi:hypothetical protein